MNPFFDHPILNSPYEYPSRHWELDADGQPTQEIIEDRRQAEFISPIPKPKKHKTALAQRAFVFDEGLGLSTARHQYDLTSIINEVRQHVATWRQLPPRLTYCADCAICEQNGLHDLSSYLYRCIRS